MRTFKCPCCGDTVETIGSEVKHRCRGKLRTYELVDDKEKTT